MRIVIAMILIVALVVSLAVFYSSISLMIRRISDTSDLDSIVEEIQGYLLIVIFLNIGFLALLAKTMFDIYHDAKENHYTIEISKMTSTIDQQTSIDKLDFVNDRLVKLVGNFANNVSNNTKRVYSALYQTYMIKSMKTEKDFEKIKMYTAILMRAYAESYSMREIYTDKKIERIANAAVMYDIGKLGTPGYILYKETNLDQSDYEMAKRHALVGFNLMEAIKPEMMQGSYEQYMRDICGYHHERFDGTGYPWGIKGEEIPFIARVIALITTYETITRDRPYKKAMTHEEALILVNNEKGRYFDPKIVKIFNAVEREFKKIKEIEL
ncbi:MAG: HD domain-containing phosphohydrolase [Bacilli bacterium]